jgi:hydrogenase nickel incorporation protein HypB
MCDTCGCGDPNLVSVEVHESILAVNDRTAAHNREHLAAQGVFAVNLMGSPGAGKTAVLEATAQALAGRLRLGVIAGDLETERDADRLRAVDVPAAAITTGTACHLDAEMVHRALHRFSTHDLDYLFVENVGNLVCPAVYDLGQAANVVALSVTEGEDKPLKYPIMFRKADLVLLTKVDLLPHLDLDVPALEAGLARVAPGASLLRVSARTGEGVTEWVGWLQARAATTPPPSREGQGHTHTHSGGRGMIDAAAPSSGRAKS